MKYHQKAIAMCSKDQKQNVIAFGVRNRKIVSIGKNSYIKTHPKQKKYAILVNEPERIYLHAEIAAIINSPVKLDSLFVYRIKNGVLQNAKPCPICQSALESADIRYFHS